jgi:hypothetical protein
MGDSDSGSGSTSIHEREQQRLMLRFILGLLYKVFPVRAQSWKAQHKLQT